MITKKIKKFITSKVFYLALGIFLASAVIAYATTWNDARTTDNANPNELTKDNWNAFVDMLESGL